MVFLACQDVQVSFQVHGYKLWCFYNNLLSSVNNIWTLEVYIIVISNFKTPFDLHTIPWNSKIPSDGGGVALVTYTTQVYVSTILASHLLCSIFAPLDRGPYLQIWANFNTLKVDPKIITGIIVIIVSIRSHILGLVRCIKSLARNPNRYKCDLMISLGSQVCLTIR